MDGKGKKEGWTFLLTAFCFSVWCTGKHGFACLHYELTNTFRRRHSIIGHKRAGRLAMKKKYQTVARLHSITSSSLHESALRLPGACDGDILFFFTNVPMCDEPGQSGELALAAACCDCACHTCSRFYDSSEGSMTLFQ